MLLGPGTHYIVQKGDKDGAFFFKIVNIMFIVALVVIFVVSFFLMGGFDSDKILDKWAALTALEKLKFDDDIQNLVDKNKKNLLLHAIYNIVLTILFVILTCLLFAFDSNLPKVWFRVAKARNSLAEGIQFSILILQ